MSWKNTFRWVKESGLPKRIWLEEDEHAEVELSVVDERDSVSLQLKALTKSRLGPEFRSVSSIRISYSDLVELVHQGQEILSNHMNEASKS